MLFGSLGLDIVTPLTGRLILLIYALSDYFGRIISCDLVRQYTAPCLMSHTPQRCYHSALIILSRLPREPTRFFCIRRLSSLRIIYSGLTVSRRIFIIKNSSCMLFSAHTKRLRYLTSIQKKTTIIPEVWLCSSHLCVRAVYMWEVTAVCRPMLQLLLFWKLALGLPS